MATNGPLDEWIGVGEAAGLLETTEEQVRVMIAEGLLTDGSGGDGPVRLQRAEVLAVGELGA